MSGDDELGILPTHHSSHGVGAEMHYNARPAWRYQWSAVVSTVAMIVLAVLIGVYGPAHLGVRVAHVLLGASAALAVYFLLLMLFRHLSWRYLIDDQNIECYEGLLARRVHSIRVADLRNVEVNQGVVQRLLGVGDVEFSSSGGDGVEVVFFGVPEPMQVMRLAQRLQGGLASAEE